MARHSRHLLLRPVYPDDIPFLYFLVSDPVVSETWRFQGAVPDPVVFSETYRQGVLAQFIVQRYDSTAIGHVVAYGHNERAGWCYIGGAFVPSTWHSGLPIEGLLCFIEHLFSTQPLRKVYAEMEVTNFHRVASGIGKIFDVEGRLSGHLFSQGEFHDMIIMSFDRTKFMHEVVGRYARILRPRPDSPRA